ncbi:4200_t:CDS:2, partial [Gigaspora margarita]
WLKYKNKAGKETTNKDIKEVHKGKEIKNELNKQNQTIDSFSKKLALEITEFANQIKYTRNIAESKDGIDIKKLMNEINKVSIKELFEKEIRILEERYTDNQVMQAATSQTKVKKSSEDANISNRPQAKTKLPNNIELEVTVWDLLNYNKKRHLEILFKKLSDVEEGKTRKTGKAENKFNKKIRDINTKRYQRSEELFRKKIHSYFKLSELARNKKNSNALVVLKRKKGPENAIKSGPSKKQSKESLNKMKEHIDNIKTISSLKIASFNINRIKTNRRKLEGILE